MSMVDLLSILPFYLPFVHADLRSLRALRLLRLFRIAKILRYYSRLNLIRRVFEAKKEELILTSILIVLLLVVSSSVLFYCENPVQPDVFSSIPATMWWAVTTFTTVGYGDIYPVTLMGKFFAGIVAILGIGMFALPTGILSAGFVEEVQRAKAPGRACPHCGREIK
jgi:voltage-gated potassium channel